MALPTSEYFWGKGKVSIVERNATTGVTGKVLYVGNCPSFKLSLKTEKLEHFESMSGENQQDLDLIKTIGAEVSFTLESIARDNAEILLWGDTQTVASASNRIDTLPSGAANGDTYLLTRGAITNVDSVVDSAGGPATVTPSLYEVDTDFGSIKFVGDISAYTQPLKVQYDSAAQYALPMFSTDRPQRFIRAELTNDANAGAQKKYIVELYYVPLDPVSDLDLIGDDVGKFEVKGSALIDSTREDDANLGRFGRIVYLQAA